MPCAIPIFGTVGAVGINVLLNGIFTHRLGKALVRIFENKSFSGEEFMDVAITILPLLAGLPSIPEVQAIIGDISGTAHDNVTS